MSDYQQTSGNIRSFLATKAQTWTDHTADLAAHYASLCDEINQRLRRCADYLSRGMWPAAIHLADCQPNLVQSVALLKFPERAAWADLCVTHGMPAPAMLEDECLEALKGAYAQEKKLEPLLSRHRLLAIANAPVRDRLELARLLAAEDSSNPAWALEIILLETSRLEELTAEVRAALCDLDDARIQSLHKEVENSPWRQEVPPGLRDIIQKSIAELKTRQVMAELPKAAAELASTFQNHGAGSEVASLISQWEELLATPGVTVPEELAARVQPAFVGQLASERRQNELEEVKPLDHLFTDAAPALTSRRKPGISVWLKALVPLVLIVAIITYCYVIHLRK